MSHHKLTWRDIRSIQRQMLDRLRRDGDTHVVGVGLGVKNAHRKPGKRVASVVVIVDRKMPPKQLAKKVLMGKRRRVQVRVGSGAHRRHLRLATDVIQVPHAVPIALSIGSGQSSGSAGIIITWISKRTRQWGVLTAGHVLDAANPQVFVLGSSVQGQSIFRSTPGDPLDVGVFRIAQADAEQLSPGVTKLAATFQIQPRSFAALVDDQKLSNERGLCLAPASSVNFNVDLLTAGPVDWIEMLPGLVNLIKVSADDDAIAPPPFRAGRSGSPCLETPQNAAMGLLIAANSDGFTTGFVQALATSLNFVRQRFADDPAIVAQHMRLMAIL